jgi:prefoldin subunit 5
MGFGMRDQITNQMLALEQQMQAIHQRLAEINSVRNDAIEEVAVAIEQMKAFGQDTVSSLAIYIRELKDD